MALLLNVPYSEKEEVKKLGAKWSPKLKKWYVLEPSQYHLFKKWFNEQEATVIVQDKLYLLEGINTCFKCGAKTKVVSLGVGSHVTVHDDSLEIVEEGIHFIQDIQKLPEQLEQFLKEKYHFYNSYSRTARRNYYGNHCSKCGVLQGNSYLYNDLEGPFFLKDKNAAKNLTVYPIDLKYDLELDVAVSYTDEDSMIEQFANFKESLYAELEETSQEEKKETAPAASNQPSGLSKLLGIFKKL